MNIRVVDNDNDFDQLEQSWSELVSLADLHIFQTFEWNRTWWKYFGAGRKLHLILIYDDSRLVGIMPLFWDTVHLMGWRIYSSLRFLGSNISQPKGKPLIGIVAYTDYLDMIVDPDYEKQVALILTDYFKNEKLHHDEILFEEVPEESMIRSQLLPALEEAGVKYQVHDDSKCVNIKLNDSWEDYLMSVGKNRRKKLRRYLRNISDEKSKVFELHELQNKDDLHELFETLVQVHQQQWNSQGFPGMFYENRIYEFTKETALKFFRNGWLQIRKLTPTKNEDDTCVAIDMFYMYNKRVYSIIGGIDYNSPLLSHSPGNTLFAETLKKAIEEEKPEVFDYLRGLQKYKLKKGDKVTTNKKILIQYPLGRNSWRVSFAKGITQMKRRIRVEVIHVKISFRGKIIMSGVRNYLSFLMQRLEKKWKNKSKFISSKWIFKLLLTQDLLIY